MKLLTLNTHSLHGEDTDGALEEICRFCIKNRPDIIALQEVNQSRSAPLYQGALPRGYHFCQDRVLLRQDHFGIRLLTVLAAAEMPYDWSWLPVKLGYGRFDEGLLTLSRRPLAEARGILVSENRPYEDWRRRMALFVRPEGSEEWFVNLHLSWWQDREEPFLKQWSRLLRSLPQGKKIWLMGDWNAPADLRGEGYDRVTADGFFDCYCLARQRDGSATAFSDIDGWNGQGGEKRGLRIDQIRCNHPPTVFSCRVVFDGREEAPVSDHFGVFVETE